MTNVQSSIKYAPDSINISPDIFRRIDLWSKIGEGIGRFRLSIRNTNQEYSNSFAADDPIEIKISDVIFFRGYLDIIKPIGLDENSVHEEIMELSGRDYGQDLMNKRVAGLYKKQPADDIIDDLLANANSEIQFTSQSTAPAIPYEGLEDYLINHFRNIWERIDYEGRVKLDKNLELFPIGSINSGITLKSVAGALDNNILELKKIEKDSLDVWNYIVVGSVDLQDGWTEGTVNYWSGRPNNTISDEYVIVKKGAGSLKSVRGTGSDLGFELTFPKFDYDLLDLSTFSKEQISFCVYFVTQPNAHDLWIDLEDDQGNIIRYRFTRTNITSDCIADEKWHQLEVPVGYDAFLDDTLVAPHPGKFWWFWVTKISDPFTWKIKKISICADTVDPANNPTDPTDYMILDGFSAPVLLRAIAQDGGPGSSQENYKVRMKRVRLGVQSYLDLLEEANSQLEKLKDPYEALEVTAVGSAGIIGNENKWIPGYYLTVNAPEDNINNIEYRMVEVHCIVAEAPISHGYDFIVKLLLVPKDLKIKNETFSFAHRNDLGIFRELRGYIKYLEEKMERQKDFFFPLIKPFSHKYDIDEIEAGQHHDYPVPDAGISEDVGIISSELPVIDPDEYSVCWDMAGWSDWEDSRIIKFDNAAKIKHNLEKVTLQCKLEDPATSDGQVRIMYSTDNGQSWSQFGVTESILYDYFYTEEFTASITTNFNEPLWIKAQVRCGNVTELIGIAYMKYHTLVNRKFKGRHQPI